MKNRFRFRHHGVTAMSLAVAAAGFGGFAASDQDGLADAGPTAVTETAAQQCSAPIDAEWRDWRRPRGVAIPR